MTLIWTYGVRNTTLLTALAFVVVGLARRRPSALLAAAAWLVGFEALWQWTYMVMSGLDPHMWTWISDGWAWAPGALAVAGPATALAARLAGARIERRWLLLTAALWVVWVLDGLRANYPGRPFDIVAELINVSVKTTWALAYLVPLARARRSDVERLSGDRRRGLTDDLAQGGVRVDVAPELPGVALE